MPLTPLHYIAKFRRRGLGAPLAQFGPGWRRWCSERSVMPRRTRAEIEATAYHEAGHTVVAHFLGRPIQSLTIRQRGNRAGHVKSYSKRTGDERLVETLMVRSAGIEAEALFVWLWGSAEQIEAAERRGLRGASDDAREIARLLGKDWDKKAERREVIQEIADIGRRVRRVLTAPGSFCAWQAVAAELLKRRTLRGEEARSIIEQAFETHRGLPSVMPGVLAKRRRGS